MKKAHHGHHGHHKSHGHHGHHGHHSGHHGHHAHHAHHHKHHGHHSEYSHAMGKYIPGGPDGNGMGTHEYHEPHNPIMAMGGGGLHGPQGSYHDASAGHGEMGGRAYGVAPGKCSGCMK
jgi:hypothetical protein